MVDPSSYFVEFDGSVWFNNDPESYKDDLIDQSFKLELMQYTGLKDKSGAEIYEGDIIKATALNNDHHQRGATSMTEVAIRMGNVCLGENGPTLYPFNVSHTIEVIGNIHQNPELLKGE